MPKCDFCSSTQPAWDFPCETFALANLQTRSQGNWLACDDCAELIVGERWRELAKECCEKTANGRMLIDLVGMERAIDQAMRMHAGFRKYRSGEPRRLP